MTRYMLDTNHLSPLVTQGHHLRIRVLELQTQGNTFDIAVPALTEFLFGILLTPRVATNLEEWEELQSKFGFLGIGRREAEQAADLQATLRRKGWQLATIDALIATVALRDELILLTTDKDFDAVPNLQIQNWLIR